MSARFVSDPAQVAALLKQYGSNNAHTLSMTSRGLVGAGVAAPSGVPANFHLKQQAVLEFMKGPARSQQQRGNFKGENAYRNYYDDLCANPSEWMSFFEHVANKIHGEHTCGILGTLATVYRQRGSLDVCRNVLAMEGQVLKRYKVHCTSPASRECCDSLEFKMNVIAYNTAHELEDFDEGVRLLRLLMDYELRNKVSDEMFLFLPEVLLDKPVSTKADLDAVNDHQLLMIMKIGIQLKKNERNEPAFLHTCSHCSKKEAFVAQFKRCARCDGTWYCNRDCQRGHWKIHKKVCRPAK